MREKGLYYNPKRVIHPLTNYGKKIQESGIDISLIHLKKFLEQQETYQINKQVKKPNEYSNIVADYPLQSTQLDIMIYDRYQIHSYKYVIGLIDVYSRYVVCRALTNMKISTILSNLKEMCEELSKKAGSLRTVEGYKETHYPENMNTHQQFDNLL